MTKELELLKKIRTFAKDHYPMQMHGLVVEIDEVLKEHEPKWYENLPEQGRLCWVSDDDVPDNPNVRRDIRAIVAYVEGDSKGAYRTAFRGWWRYAIPLTDEEIKQFLTGAP